MEGLGHNIGKICLMLFFFINIPYDTCLEMVLPCCSLCISRDNPIAKTYRILWPVTKIAFPQEAALIYSHNIQFYGELKRILMIQSPYLTL